MKSMTTKGFASVTARDFENRAIRDEILAALQDRDDLLEACIAAKDSILDTHDIGRQLRAAIAKATNGKEKIGRWDKREWEGSEDGRRTHVWCDRWSNDGAFYVGDEPPSDEEIAAIAKAKKGA